MFLTADEVRGDAMTNGMLVTESDLCKWVTKNGKPVRRSTIEAWLKKNQVPFFYGQHGAICTTMDAINQRLFGQLKITGEWEF